MELLQQIVVYLIVVLAIGYLVGKFLLPKSFLASKKGSKKGCGHEDCGCH